MRHLGGGRDDAGDRGVAGDEFQDELAPAGYIDIRRPWRQRLAARRGEELPVLEGAIDEHRHAALGGEWQQASLGGACCRRVVELDEVEGLAGQHALETGVRGDGVVRHADVTYAPRRLPFPERRELRVEIQ